MVAVQTCRVAVVMTVFLAGCMLRFPTVAEDAGSVCGNGVIDEQELCDDGNREEGDGCSSTCKVEKGWACVGQPSICHSSLCGDNIRADQESCDGSELAGMSCQSRGYSAGVLRCHSDCSFDESGCAVCGDGGCEQKKGESIDNCPSDCAFVQMSVGYQTSCALRADGTVWCWGANDNGQLGSGETSAYESAPLQVVGISSAVQVDVGGFHACALVQVEDGDSEVWCWGRNRFGQLGNSDLDSQPVPSKVVGIDDLVVHVDVGWELSCALLSSGDVACWGTGRNGVLGCNIDTSTHPEPVHLDWSEKMDDLSCDAGACCVRVAATREVKCWGSNPHGGLGQDTIDSTCIPVPVDSIPEAAYLNTGDYYGCIIDAGGISWCWGANDHGQITDTNVTERLAPIPLPDTPRLQHVWLGWYHTCATTRNGAALCWGSNDQGQLGTGQTDDLPQPPSQVFGIDSGAIDVEAGWDFSCALLDSGRIRCWGANDTGQLGDGSLDPSIVPVDLKVF